MSHTLPSRTVEILSDARYVQAESPRWDGRDGTLAWIDMATGSLHRGRIEHGRVVPETVVGTRDDPPLLDHAAVERAGRHVDPGEAAVAGIPPRRLGLDVSRVGEDLDGAGERGT